MLKPAHPSPFYFFPDFLIPCDPAFIGPFPFAFSAISLFAFASDTGCQSHPPTTARNSQPTGFLLLSERYVILIKVL